MQLHFFFFLVKVWPSMYVMWGIWVSFGLLLLMVRLCFSCLAVYCKAQLSVYIHDLSYLMSVF